MAQKRKVRNLALNALKELLDYNPITGVFTWRVNRGGMKVGSEAGCINKSTGYRVIEINGKPYKAHQLAWFMTYGEWGKDGYDLDHFNNVRADNRLVNLQLTIENDRKGCLRSNNTTGLPFLSINKMNGKDFYFRVQWYNRGETKQSTKQFPFATYGIFIDPSTTSQEASEMVCSGRIEIPQEILDFIETNIKPLYAPTHGMTAEQMALYHSLQQ